MDLYSKSIISWVLTKTMDADEVLKCIEKAKGKRNIVKPLVIQSNRGVQYTSTKYRELTSEFIRSYSRKRTPWDNACVESFHSLIKREWLNFHKIQNYNHAYRLIFEYIEGFYNTEEFIHIVGIYHLHNLNKNTYFKAIKGLLQIIIIFKLSEILT